MLESRTRRDSSLMRPTGSRLPSKLAMAIAIGIFCGGVFALLNQQYGLFSFTEQMGEIYQHSQILGKQQSSKCESPEYVNIMKSQYIQASDENEELKKDVDRLTRELSSAKHEREIAQRQVLMLGKHQAAGPFGTVKNLRTSPTVAPDATVNPRLAKILEGVAVEREVLVALANRYVGGLLQVWFRTIKRVGISNYLVVALDDATASFCRQNGVPVYERGRDEEIANTSDNHVISGLKFRILREFLQLGYSVILSDVDVVFLQNPFDHLHRDSDIESMSDGHDNSTAYGYDDLFEDPAMGNGMTRYAHTIRLWMYNCGFFFIRPTIPSIELLDRVAARLSRGVNKWDQEVFNEELFLPSRPGYEGLHASRRTMDFYLFMNSKVLFKTVRKDARFKELKPVVVHVSYHPDKLPRMEAVVEYYVNGKQDALDAWPVGYEYPYS